MLQTAAEAAGDVFCDVQDAVAERHGKVWQDIAWALSNRDGRHKVRCVLINDITTAWRRDDILTIAEPAGVNRTRSS